MIKLKDLFSQDEIEIFLPNPNDLTYRKRYKSIYFMKIP